MKDFMKKGVLSVGVLLFFLFCTNFADGEEKIWLKGKVDNVIGKVVSENDEALTLMTDYGILLIKKSDIALREIVNPNPPKDILTRIVLANGNYIDGSIINEFDEFLLLETKYGAISIKKSEIVSKEKIKELPQIESPPPKIEEPPEVKTQQINPPVPKIIVPAKSPLDLLIAKLIDSKNDEEKQRICNEIMNLGPAIASSLVDYMEKVDDNTLAVISNMLVFLNNQDTINPLTKKLESKNPKVRASAISLLGIIGGSDVVPKIKNFIYDKDANVRGTVVDIIAKFDDIESLDEVLPLILDTDPVFRKRVSNAIVSLSSKLESQNMLVESLCRLLSEASSDAQVDIISTLMQMKSKIASASLIELINSESNDVRAMTIIALGQLKAVDAADAIAARIPEENDEWVKIQIAGALAELNVYNTVPSLIEMLKDDSLKVRESANRALRNMTHQYFGLNYEQWSQWWKSRTGKTE